ncbi:neuron navigator 2-like [Sinocyclocheilus grahami]|uniref:neuron navigator 2-like n=1 Tax=Sinocyclocheilus grahami TaxID=75366 RepID=UPI0007ACFAB8|nr:PREDICTED: neuron navigator 2-like [Sinocyclocheilus grahami]
MPAILVVTNMKSGLPKPIHSALPIPQVPTRAVAPRPCFTSPPQSNAHLHLETQSGWATGKNYHPADSGEDTQIYTDWANHYLAKSGHKRLIKDLQQDVSDGVLLAEIIQVIANEKIEDINGCPKSRSQMIENIDACLSFLAAKGVNIQGLSAEEIRNGNLKAILGLFFSLSRYKQQQTTNRQMHTQHTQSHTPLIQQSSTLAQLTTSHGTHTHKTQPEMQSRLPGPTSRMSTAGSESSPRGSISSAGNRRSQVFSDKAKPAAAAQAKESSECVSSHGVTEHTLSSLASACTSVSTSTVASSSSSSAIPQPNSSSKPWRSKSQSTKHTATSTATSTVLSIKSDLQAKEPVPAEPPPKAVPQKSMLEKLKLFNSKGGSKSSTQAESAVTPTGGKDGGLVLERVEAGSNTKPTEEMDGNVRPTNGSSAVMMTTSSPKIALKGIAQRTFSRALTGKKASTKAIDKEKERAKEKDKNGKEGSRCVPSSEKVEIKEEVREEVVPSSRVAPSEAEPRKASKIASFIPKGGKVGGTKKDSPAPVQSGIPKPGSKNTGNGAVKSSALPLSGKDNERPRSMRLGGGLGLHRDSRHSSSSSSLASAEGKGHHSAAPVANGTQSTASNTVSVQLPQPQQQYSHPNTATVAPFMYRSQNEADGNIGTIPSCGCRSSDSSSFSKINQSSTEDLSGEDPETRRLRTVKNIADLRQNLEETMSSLRGTQITHSTLETTFDGSVTTEMSSRSILSMASRPAPLSWASRIGQSSPRLQAGDAPSVGNGYQSRSGGVASGQGRYLYQAPLRKQLAARGSALCGLELGDRVEDLELAGVGLEMSGYMSDGDVLAKNARSDELTSGILFPPTVSLICLQHTCAAIAHLGNWINMMSMFKHSKQADLMTRDREMLGISQARFFQAMMKALLLRKVGQMRDSVSLFVCVSICVNVSERFSGFLVYGDSSDLQAFKIMRHLFPEINLIISTSATGIYGRHGHRVSWDDSSSVSSGVSDAIDTDDINTGSSVSSYANTPAASRKALNGQPQTDAEKHSATERNTAWSSDEVKMKSDGGLEAGLKWRRNPSDVSEESDKCSSGRKTAPITQTGSWRRGMSAQVGVTAPRTKSTTATTGTGMIKTQGTGKTDDAKVSEKGRMSPSSNIVQHSSSDAGRSSGDEAKKTPAGRVPTSTFGFKKPNGAHGPATVVTTSSITLVTASGATITSGSATLGKIPKSSALLVGGRASLKGAVDGLLPPQEDGYLSPSARSTLQYRSLPRPSRSGATSRNGNRSSTSSIESSLSSRTPVLTAVTTSKPRDSGTKINGHAIQANQTDKEKGVASEMDNLRTNPIVSGGGAATIPQTARQGNKYSEVSSPTLRRLFGGKAAKQAPVTSAESMKNSVVISNPHATLGHTQSFGGPLDSPNTIPGSGGSSPLYGGRGASIGGSEQASSPGSVYSTCTGTWGTTISSSSALGYPSVSSMHTSSESIDMSVGSGHHRDDVHPLLMRTGSAKTGMSESPLSSPSASPKFSRNTLPRKQDRYAPSTQLRQEEARDWLRSHSAGGLQDSTSNSPFSTGSSLTSPSGTRFNFAQLGSPTTGAQINLASLRNNSLTNQDNPLDSHGDSRLRNSCMSLDEKTRTMSRSGSFRDGFEEVHGSSLSLVSSTSSVYSTIRKLRRELDASQEKVSALTTQLSANCKSERTGNNSSAPGAQPDLRMRRQHSSDSVSSITSATSHSSLGSNMDNTDSSSKKKKKNWLRSSFKQAFSKKKSPKSASSHSDIEEMTDSSLPSSPKLPHNGTSTSALLLRNTHSSSILSDCLDGEAESVMQLRNELREKEMKLTDIRLEALSSAHQLDQLREAMNRMQVEIEKLKVENDRLKLESQASGSRASSQVSVYNATPTPTPGLSQHSLNLTESTSFDMLLDDSGGDGSSRKESRNVKIVVSLQEDVTWKEDCRTRDFLIGCIGVSGKTKWDVLDGVVRRLFKAFGSLTCGTTPSSPTCWRLPYIIGTMSQATSSAPNLQLHHNFRWVLCANHMEPVKGFLGRFLRRKLIETEIGSRTRNLELVKIIDWIPQVWHHLNRFLEAHSSSDVTIGPRLFLSCPMDLYGHRAAWEDPALWVLETFPWAASHQHPDWPALLQLRPEDVGFDGYSASREGLNKQSTQSDSDADPLMNMLLRLKEAASCSSPQSYDSDSNSNSHHDDILDSSLESTL